MDRIRESDWSAGQFLYNLLKDGQFHGFTDERARLLLLEEGTELISFCTLSAQDDIVAPDLVPWIGFVYTFPQYRGNRYAGELIEYAAELAKTEGCHRLYVCTDQEGIYETYGFVYLETRKDRRGGDARVYVRQL